MATDITESSSVQPLEDGESGGLPFQQLIELLLKAAYQVSPKGFTMRRFVAASALLMLFSATPGMAEDYPWCVGEPNQASLQCRFTSFEECQGTALGMGECYRNPTFTKSQAPSTVNSPPPATVNTSRKKHS